MRNWCRQVIQEGDQENSWKGAVDALMSDLFIVSHREFVVNVIESLLV